MPEPQRTHWGHPEGLLQMFVVPEASSTWVTLTLGHRLMGAPMEIDLPGSDPRVAARLVGVLLRQLVPLGGALTVTMPFRVVIVTPNAAPVPWQEDLLPGDDVRTKVLNVDLVQSEEAALSDLVTGKLVEWPRNSRWLYIGSPDFIGRVASQVERDGKVQGLTRALTSPTGYPWNDVPALAGRLLTSFVSRGGTHVRLLLGRGVAGYGLETRVVEGIRHEVSQAGFTLHADGPVLRTPVAAVVNGALRVAAEPEMPS